MGGSESDRGNRMGLLGATSYIIGNIVGSGIFITPTAILQRTQSVGLSLCIWLISGVMSIFGAFCYAELGTIVNESGADFAYLCHVKWFPVAFAFMCAGCLINYPCIVAIQAQTFGEYVFQGLNLDIGEAETYYARKLLELTLISGLMFLNFFSLGTCVSKFNIVASASKLLATGIVISVGFYLLVFRGRTENFSAPFEGSVFVPENIVSAFFAGLYTYDGWDILNFGAEEIDRPRRTMPLAITIGMSMVVAIYLATNIAYFAVLDVPAMLSSRAVAFTFAEETLGDFSVIIPILVCMLMVGSLNSTIFAASRFLHAAAKKGFLPTFISCTNPQTDSPRAALIVHVILVFGMTFVGNVEELIDYAGFAQWSQRATTMLVLFWIRCRHSEEAKAATVRPPWIIPLLFFLTCSSLVLTTLVKNMHVAGMSLIILLSAVVIYFSFLYRRGLRAWTPYAEWSSKFDYCTTAGVQVVLNVMPQRTFLEETASVATIADNDSRASSLKKRKIPSRRSATNQRVAPVAEEPRPTKY